MGNRFKITRVNAFWIAIVILVAVSFLNILVLDILFLQTKKNISSIVKSNESARTFVSKDQEDEICPKSCISEIDKVSSYLSGKTTAQTIISSDVKEILITLGSGTNKSTEYENVSTAQVFLDPTKYGKIKSVKFEVSLEVPTANQYVYVRLFNITDNNPVWNSEMYMSGGPSANLVSESIGLANGNKQYVVQMKSQLKHLTNLNQSRLRIETY